MELGGTELTAITGAASAAVAAIAGGVKVLAVKIGARFERIENEARICAEKHVEDRELIGGLRAELQGVKAMIETLKVKPDGAR